MKNINTAKYEEIISSVLIDDREKSRIDYALSQYSSFNPVKCHLDIGDYIFVGSNGLKVVWEYKWGNDFLTSINSGHLHNQVYDMAHNFDYCFVMVESENLREEMQSLYFHSGIDMSFSQVNGAIAEYSTIATVLQTQTRYQAFDLMMRTSAKLILNRPWKYNYGKKSTNWALNILSSMRGLDNKAEVICRTLNLHTLDDVLNLDKEQLVSVKGVGDKLADKILKNIGEGRSHELQNKN